MKQITQVVDMELSEEETLTLLRAKVILKELHINLKKIEVKRQPYAIDIVKKAADEINGVMNSYGALLDDNDAEVRKLDERYQKLEDEEEKLL
ncbi:MAG: hypothetical protein J6V44_16555 [Methanobrevibacter sp.]|nr:hypothetical protein [Methanobrevibacter sp.]MBO7691986.1 hypothetical protein [Methanobrevibacter sp.]